MYIHCTIALLAHSFLICSLTTQNRIIQDSVTCHSFLTRQKAKKEMKAFASAKKASSRKLKGAVISSKMPSYIHRAYVFPHKKLNIGDQRAWNVK